VESGCRCGARIGSVACPEIQYLKASITDQQRDEFGELVHETVRQIVLVMLTHFGTHPISLGWRFLAEMPPGHLSPASKKMDEIVRIPEERRPTVLALLDSEIERIDLHIEMCNDTSTFRSQIIAGVDLPTAWRYESMLDRQLHRALNELERHQRARLGDFVPPPVKVELSGP
jgi:hypothetical protein